MLELAPPFEPAHSEEPRSARLRTLLDGLAVTPDGAFTLSLAAGDAGEPLLTDADPPFALSTLHAVLHRRKPGPDGIVFFWSPEIAYAVRPPLPPAASARLAGWQTGPLIELLGQPHLLAVLLLRRGGYAVGVFQGDLLVASKSGTRFVKNRHRKGGQSQRRFDRIREKQVDELFDKTCEVARERLEPYLPRLDALFLGGDRRTVQEFLPACRFLQSLGPRLRPRFISTPEPRHETLRLAYDTIWRSEWTELRPQSSQAAHREEECV